MALRLPPSGFTDRTARIAGVGYASWLRRLGGWAIDFLILSMIQYLLGGILSFLPNPVTGTLVSLLLFLVLFTGVGIAYATLCLYRLHGQTPGMAALRIRCVPAAGHGKVSLAQALTRSVAAAVVTDGLYYAWRSSSSLGWLAFLGLLAAYLWPLVDSRRQTWWDHLAATVVLDERGW